jgi:hypothetical protein
MDSCPQIECLPCGSPYRNASWLFALEFVPSDAHLTPVLIDDWPENGGLAIRFLFGFENPTGFGVRGRLGSFVQVIGISSASRPTWEEFALIAGNFNFEAYKRFFIEDTELVVGAGPAAGDVTFELTFEEPAGRVIQESEFKGGGVSGFVEGWHPFLRYNRIDLGLVGRGRLTLLTGDWRDNTGFFFPATNNDSMQVFELAWGLELRRRFGANEDKYWFFALLFERQTRESAWLTRVAATSLGFSGVNLAFGLMW